MNSNVSPAPSAIRYQLFTALLLVGMILVSAVAGTTVAQQKNRNQFAQQSSNSAQQGNSDAAAKIFSAGKDLIFEQEWSKAQEKFKQLVTSYPNDKNVEASMYWLAYAQSKLSQTKDCRETLQQLLEKFPNTQWRNDARSLLAQTPGAPSLIYALDVPSITTIRPTIQYAPAAPMADFSTPVVPGAASVWPQGAFNLERDPNAADDDPCEFKIVVLQALFQTDVQRGIVVATDWLKSGSGQTVRCKGAALTLLGRHGGKAVTPVILGYARSEQDLKLKARAISALGATNDDTVVDALRDFALSSTENDVVEASLYALSRHTGDRAVAVLGEIASNASKPISLRRQAISSIASRPGEPAVDALLKIYDSDQTTEIRRSVISGFGNRKSERAGAKLVEIVRGSDVVELRKAAVSAISRRGGDKVIDTLLGLYDTEKSEEVKDQIMSALGGSIIYSNLTTAKGQAVAAVAGGGSRTSDPRVIQKFIEIARNPQTPMERRKRAIGWLSRSNDPAVLKFLEDLLK